MFVLFCVTVNERIAIKDHYEPLLERRRQEIAALADQRRDLLEFQENYDQIHAELEMWEQQV